MNVNIRKHFYIIIIINMNVPIKKNSIKHGEIPEMEQTDGKNNILIW